MTESLLRMLVWVTIGLALTLLLRRPSRNVFGAGPAYTLWCLPVVLAVAPLLVHFSRTEKLSAKDVAELRKLVERLERKERRRD